MDLDDIKEEVKHICNEKFESTNMRSNWLFEKTEPSEVKKFILGNLSERNSIKEKSLDLAVYIFKIGQDTFVSV